MVPWTFAQKHGLNMYCSVELGVSGDLLNDHFPFYTS